MVTKFRQGDVLIMKSRKRRPNREPLKRDGGRVVLAYGEATGHAHAIANRGARLYEIEGLEDRFLEVLARGGVDLVHEEHGTITLPRGNYVVRRQREYSPQEIRRVAD